MPRRTATACSLSPWGPHGAPGASQAGMPCAAQVSRNAFPSRWLSHRYSWHRGISPQQSNDTVSFVSMETKLGQEEQEAPQGHQSLGPQRKTQPPPLSSGSSTPQAWSARPLDVPCSRGEGTCPGALGLLLTRHCPPGLVSGS